MKILKIAGYSIVTVVLLLIMLGAGMFFNVIKLPIKVVSHGSYAFDFDNDKTLVENSGNVFIGKVIRKTGEDVLGLAVVATQFDVEIISNLKGDLRGEVIVAQQIGYKNGLMIVHDGDVARVEDVGSEETYFLQPGSTYLFATGYYPERNWHILFTHQKASKLLSQDKGRSISELQQIANDDPRVRTLRAVIAKPVGSE